MELRVGGFEEVWRGGWERRGRKLEIYSQERPARSWNLSSGELSELNSFKTKDRTIGRALRDFKWKLVTTKLLPVTRANSGASSFSLTTFEDSTTIVGEADMKRRISVVYEE